MFADALRGVSATASMVNIAPPQQSSRASKVRGVKSADSEPLNFFIIAPPIGPAGGTVGAEPERRLAKNPARCHGFFTRDSEVVKRLKTSAATSRDTRRGTRARV